MKHIPNYFFYKTKYGEELLIDVVELQHIKKYVEKDPIHQLSYYDITFITEGKGNFHIEDKAYYVKPHDVIFSKPGEIRKWDKERIINGYALIFEEEFLTSFFNDIHFLQNLSFFHSTKPTAKISLDKEQIQILELLNKIKNEIKTYQTKDKHILRALLYEILTHLQRIYSKSNAITVKPVVTNSHVDKFIQLVERDFKQERSICYYADKLCLTPNYLNEVVKRTLGINAKQYIQNKTLTEIKKKLTYSPFSISEIAEEFHFDNISYFIRSFRKQTGKTPLNYRKSTQP